MSFHFFRNGEFVPTLAVCILFDETNAAFASSPCVGPAGFMSATQKQLESTRRDTGEWVHDSLKYEMHQKHSYFINVRVDQSGVHDIATCGVAIFPRLICHEAHPFSQQQLFGDQGPSSEISMEKLSDRTITTNTTTGTTKTCQFHARAIPIYIPIYIFPARKGHYSQTNSVYAH
ncbi:uncharacterized protein CLUP02_11221 [Colletotrichum lupini]|uniref:Uncharacterized protein n=1 Tax=Colletotrichum lupini TaxID=145971 RepID=A0A9Q8SY94_9PEZI|nr:uncharacterized protein CLUP02_11221 [Colletotrichum lupini]UQC85722.1 hypothetical protein CLUP02_11221 [Colletotrichum lupini]